MSIPMLLNAVHHFLGLIARAMSRTLLDQTSRLGLGVIPPPSVIIGLQDVVTKLLGTCRSLGLQKNTYNFHKSVEDRSEGTLGD